MNEQARKALEKLKEDRERIQVDAEIRPAMEQDALKDYASLATRLQAAIAKSNSEDLMRDAGVSLVIEGPWGRDYTNYYLLRLRGGKYYPQGSVFLIGLENTTQFDYVKVRIAVWQSHLTMSGLQDNLTGYVPGEQPRRLRDYSYKVVQTGSSYTWVKEQGGSADNLTTDELVQEIIGDLVIDNLPESN